LPSVAPAPKHVQDIADILARIPVEDRDDVLTAAAQEAAEAEDYDPFSPTIDPDTVTARRMRELRVEAEMTQGQLAEAMTAVGCQFECLAGCRQEQLDHGNAEQDREAEQLGEGEPAPPVFSVRSGLSGPDAADRRHGFGELTLGHLRFNP
jgi:hypothetical protein